MIDFVTYVIEHSKAVALVKKQCSTRFIKKLETELQDVYISCFDKFLQFMTEGVDWISLPEDYLEFSTLKESSINKRKLQAEVISPNHASIERDSIVDLS